MFITLFLSMFTLFTFMTNSISSVSVIFLISDDSVVFKIVMSLFLSISKGEFKISILLVNFAKLSFWVYIKDLSIDFSLSSIFSFKLSLFLGLLFVHPMLTSSTKVLFCLSFSISSFISNFLRVASIFTSFYLSIFFNIFFYYGFSYHSFFSVFINNV